MKREKWREQSLPDDLPELGPDLVAALASLDMDNFSHGEVRRFSLNIKQNKLYSIKGRLEVEVGVPTASERE